MDTAFSLLWNILNLWWSTFVDLGTEIAKVYGPGSLQVGIFWVVYLVCTVMAVAAVVIGAIWSLTWIVKLTKGTYALVVIYRAIEMLPFSWEPYRKYEVQKAINKALKERAEVLPPLFEKQKELRNQPYSLEKVLNLENIAAQKRRFWQLVNAVKDASLLPYCRIQAFSKIEYYLDDL